MTIVHSIIAFSIAAGLLTILPGPDTAVVLTTAIRAGHRAARRAALGIGAGLVAWGFAAALGLSAVLHATAELYSVFTSLCAAYLIFLAVQTFHSACRRLPSGSIDPTEITRSALPMRFGWGFRRAFVTAILNPKLGVFFVAFLPQFIPRGSSPMAMTLVLSTVQAVEALTWYLIIGLVAARAGTWLAQPRIRRILDTITGTVFAGFAVSVAVEGTR